MMAGEGSLEEMAADQAAISERCFFYLPVWLHVITSTMMIIMMIIIIMAQEAGGRGGGRVDLPD